jgi:hypothetical protein
MEISLIESIVELPSELSKSQGILEAQRIQCEAGRNLLACGVERPPLGTRIPCLLGVAGR